MGAIGSLRRCLWADFRRALLGFAMDSSRSYPGGPAAVPFFRVHVGLHWAHRSDHRGFAAVRLRQRPVVGPRFFCFRLLFPVAPPRINREEWFSQLLADAGACWSAPTGLRRLSTCIPPKRKNQSILTRTLRLLKPYKNLTSFNIRDYKTRKFNYNFSQCL